MKNLKVDKKFLWSLLSFLLFYFPVHAGENLLPSTVDDRWHYGFESSNLTTDDLCWEENDGGTTNNTSIDGYETVYRGSRSCRFVDLTTAYSGRTVISATVPVNAGAGYYAACWVYVQLAAGAISDVQIQIGIRWYDSSYNLISSTNSADLTLSAADTWERLEFSTITAPSNASYARIFIAAKETVNNNNDVVIDDAEFVESTPAVSYDYANVYWPGDFGDGWGNGDTNRLYRNHMPPGFCKNTEYVENGQYFKITKGSWDDANNWSAGYWINSWDTTWDIPRNDQGNNSNAYITDLPFSPAYATLVSKDTPTATTETFGFLVTSAEPIYISSVSGGTTDVDPGDSVTINITLSSSKCAEETVVVRYTTDNWVSSSFVEATGSGTSYSATIPGQSGGTTVSWYALTTTNGAYSNMTHSNADYLTLSCENNNDNNYSYYVYNLGDSWHVPDNAEPSGVPSMRNPKTDICKGTTVYIYNGTRFQNGSNNSDQSGGTLYYRKSGETTWNTSTFNYDTTEGDVKYWMASFVNPYIKGETVEYYLKITYTDHDVTYIYGDNANSYATGKEEEAQANPFTFVVKNSTPSVPDLTFPDGGESFSVGSSTNITWNNSTDPDGDSITYDIDYSTDNGTTWIDIGTDNDGSPYSWTVPDTPSNQCLVRIRAYDGEAYSSFDVSQNVFTIEGNFPPDAPTLVRPSSGTISNSLSHTFEWSFSDPNGDSQGGYELLIDNNSDFSSPEYDFIENTNSTSTTKTLSQGLWYWKVRCWDTAGSTGPYSSAYTLTIDTTPPVAINDLVASKTTGGKAWVDLSWTNTSDDLSGVKEYWVYRSDISAVTDSNKGDLQHPKIATDSDGTPYQDQTTSPNTLYYYAITVIDNAGNESSVSNSAYVKTARIDIDGSDSDWTGTAPTKVNSLVISNNEAIWKDKAGDRRTDPTASDDYYDLTEFRVTADDDSIYFLIRVADVLNDETYISISIDTDQSSSDTGMNWNADDSGITLGDEYESPANLHYAERNIIIHRSSSTNYGIIEMYADDGTSWYAPPTHGDGAVNFNQTSEFIEVKISRSDLGISGNATLRFSVATCDNHIVWANDGDSTVGYPVCDALDTISIVRISTGSEAGQYHNDQNNDMNAWDEDISDGDIDFYFDVRIDADGNISNTPPTSPSNLSPSNEWVSTLTPTLSWDASSDSDTGDTVTSYLVEIGTDSTLDDFVSFRVNVKGESFTIPEDLLNGVTYYWRVYARDRCGVLSTPQTTKFFTDNTPPSQPLNLSATASGTNADLTWDASTDSESGIKGYIIYRATYTGFPLTSDYQITVATDVTTNSYTDTGLTQGVTYYYRVKAENNSGLTSTESNEASCWIPANYAPDPPSNLGPSEFTSGGWTNNANPTLEFKQSDPNSTDQVQYNIIISKNPDYSSPVVNFTSSLGPQGTTNYQCPLLSEGTYYWKVKTIDENGASSTWSEAGNPAFKLDTTPPPSITDLDANVSGTNVELTWTPINDSLSGVDHQIIYRATFTITDANKALATIVNSYILPGVNSYTDTGVAEGVTYYYVITSVDKATNESSVSNNAGPVCALPTPEISETGTWYAVYFTADTSDSTYKSYFNKKICSLIRSAKSEVLLACYNLNDDDPGGDPEGSVIDALNEAYNNGVTVKVIVDDENSTQEALTKLDPGITVKWDSSADEMHNKFIVVDGEYVLTGSANFTQYNFTISDNSIVLIRDSSLASNYKAEFDEMWNGTFHGGTQTNGEYTIGGVEVRNYYGVEDEPVEGTTSSLPGMRYYVQHASESVFGAAYRADGSLNDDFDGIIDDIDAARGRGCAVRIIYDRTMSAVEAYASLDQAGHNVRLKGGESGTYDYMHNKFFIIDQDITITGSANWTHSADDYNDENIIIVNDPIFSRCFVRYFMRMYSSTSDEDTPESPAPDDTAPSSIQNVFAYSNTPGEVSVDFSASSDPGFSRYFIFIASHPFKNKTVMDAIDNDNDGAVDEEILNGVDDDGDGSIDEDNNLLPEKCIKTKGSGIVSVLLTTYNQGDPLQEGTTYYVAVVQVDVWGNESSIDFSDPDEENYNDDSYDSIVCGATPNQQPNCEIYPMASTWYSGTIQLKATASDPDDSVELVSFEYSLDDVNWYYVGSDVHQTVAPSSDTYQYNWDSTEDILIENTVYIRARARDKYGKYSEYSKTGPISIDNKAPGIPSPDDGIDASGDHWTNNNLITMSWKPVSDDGSGLKEYVFHYDTDPDEVTTSTYTTKTLSDGSHIFYVAARDNAGNMSKYGTHQVNVDATPPPAISDLTASRIFNSIELSWGEVTDATSGVAYYNIYRSLTPNPDWDSVPVLSTTTQTSYLDEGLNPGTTYYYNVRAVDKAGNLASPSNEASQWPGNPPVLGGAWHYGASYKNFTVTTTASNYYTHYYREISTTVYQEDPTKGMTVVSYAPGSFVQFARKGDTVYIFNAYKYKEWNGTEWVAVENQREDLSKFYWRMGNGSWIEEDTRFYNPDAEVYPDIYFKDTGIKYYIYIITVTVQPGTTFYYYFKIEYTTEADPDGEFSSYPYRDTTYLYDPYGTGISSPTAYEEVARAHPFKFIVINTTPTTPTVLSPNGGEALTAGNQFNIKWSSATDSDGDTIYYDLDYSIDGGNVWIGIVGNFIGTSYTWTVPDTPSDNCLIRVRAYDGTDYSDFDTSDSTFTIKKFGADHVVISEVCPFSSPGEFVELYNPTTSTITLEGWFLDVYGNDYTFQPGDKIYPHSYFLISDSSPILGVIADVFWDINITDNGANSYAILKDTSGAVVDKVGWADSSYYETEPDTSTRLGSLGTGHSWERKAEDGLSPLPGEAGESKGNSYDTDNNANDFVERTTPQPQNSSCIEPPPNANEPTLTEAGVSPDVGTTDTLFTFSVKYTDLDDNEPTVKYVFIDGEAYEMTTTDYVYENGSVFTYSTKLSVGEHSYYFYFSDGDFYVREPSTYSFTGPKVGPNLAQINVLVPPTPENGANVSITTITFQCELLGENGEADTNGWSSFQARIVWRKNGGSWNYENMNPLGDGKTFQITKYFNSGDFIEYYFQGKDIDSNWGDIEYPSDGSYLYFSINLIDSWHYPSVTLTGTGAPSDRTYRYPITPDSSQNVNLYVGSDLDDITVYVYWKATTLPEINEETGEPLTGTTRILLKYDYTVSDGENPGKYYSTFASTDPITALNDGTRVYYFIRIEKSGENTTYLTSNGQNPEGSIMRTYPPQELDECFTYLVTKAEVMYSFHIPKEALPSSRALSMRECYDSYGSYFLNPHRYDSETVYIWLGKEQREADHDGEGIDELVAKLYWKATGSGNEEAEWHVSTFTYILTEGSTDYWRSEFIQPSNSFYERGDIVMYYITLSNPGAGKIDTVVYPGAGNGAYPDTHTAYSPLSTYDPNAPYNDENFPKFWYVIANYLPVIYYPEYPADYAVDVDVSGGITLDWQDAYDGDGDTITDYEIQIDDNPNFTSPDTYTTSGNPAPSEYYVTGLSNGTVYYWRVRAKDSYGEWGPWGWNNNYWTFFTLNSPRVLWVSWEKRKPGAGWQTMLWDKEAGIYPTVYNDEEVRIKVTVYPGNADTTTLKVYYKISPQTVDPVITTIEASSPSDESYYFETDNNPSNWNWNYDNSTERGYVEWDATSSTATCWVTLPSDIHYPLGSGYYFWVQPCARTSSGEWLNGEARFYVIEDDPDTVVSGRGTGLSEYPVDNKATLTNGDSNLLSAVENYSPLRHRTTEYLFATSNKRYLTPDDDAVRVNYDQLYLDSADDYQTKQGSDGVPDVFYGEDPGIYIRTEYQDMNPSGSDLEDTQLIYSYNGTDTFYETNFRYILVYSTYLKPYTLKYNFAKLIPQDSDNDGKYIMTMPESAIIKYWFKLKDTYLLKTGLSTTPPETDAQKFSYSILQDDITRPFVWKAPSPQANIGNEDAVAGYAVNSVIITIGLADTYDGKFTYKGITYGPFKTWPGGDENASAGDPLYSDRDRFIAEGFDGWDDFTSANYWDYYVFAGNTSSDTAKQNSGVVSRSTDGLPWSARFAHATLCYYVWVSSDAGWPVDRDGSTNSSPKSDSSGAPDTETNQYIRIENVEGAGSDGNQDGYVVMEPMPGEVDEYGNGIWYANIPIPADVESRPYLYYRIWACNGDFDPQYINLERGGGEAIGSKTGGLYGSYGEVIQNPWLEEYPGGEGGGQAGGKYRDYDYGWVTRTLYAGKVITPPRIKIISTVRYKGKKRQAIIYLSVDPDTKKVQDVISYHIEPRRKPVR